MIACRMWTFYTFYALYFASVLSFDAIVGIWHKMKRPFGSLFNIKFFFKFLQKIETNSILICLFSVQWFLVCIWFLIHSICIELWYPIELTVANVVRSIFISFLCHVRHSVWCKRWRVKLKHILFETIFH